MNIISTCPSNIAGVHTPAMLWLFVDSSANTTLSKQHHLCCLASEPSCSSKSHYFTEGPKLYWIQRISFFFDWLWFFVRCSSIVSSCSAWRREHRRMATHNECLHSLSPTKRKLARNHFSWLNDPIIRHVFFSFSITQIRTERLANQMVHVCFCQHEVSKANRNSMVMPPTLLPMFEMLCLSQLPSGKCCHMAISSWGSYHAACVDIAAAFDWGRDSKSFQSF